MKIIMIYILLTCISFPTLMFAYSTPYHLFLYLFPWHISSQCWNLVHIELRLGLSKPLFYIPSTTKKITKNQSLQLHNHCYFFIIWTDLGKSDLNLNLGRFFFKMPCKGRELLHCSHHQWSWVTLQNCSLSNGTPCIQLKFGMTINDK